MPNARAAGPAAPGGGALRRLFSLPALILAIVALSAVFAGSLSPYEPNRQDLGQFVRPPSVGHPMGTDPLGRDVLSRLLYGGRVSLAVGVTSVALACVIGTIVGIASVMARTWVGEVLMRLTDTFLALPAVLVALAVAATIGPSLANVILIIGLLYWAQFARMVRAEALIVRAQDFVAAAHAIGCPPMRLLWFHMLPNVINTVIVFFTLQLASAILLESTLSFLGVGVPPPTSSWGAMVAEGRPYISLAWWIVTFPGCAIMLSVLATNLLGDRLRDSLDPRLLRSG